MKRKIGIAAAIILALFVVTGCQKQEETPKKSEQKKTEASEELLSGTHHAEIQVKDYGTITVELDADTAPITVTNFVNLAKDGFYDNLTFHGIMDGFMIQGGDPNGDGTGGADQTIKGEFSSNGVENEISHTRGTISMARAQDPDSASSQFFIVQEDSDYLDGNYAAFGHVTSGMEIVDQICKDVPVEDDNGTVKAENQPVIEKITITD
ncbi:peptidyl-prolyl cis-trans isomerase [Mediterraneibacter gnavus]|uniref:peptidylprolyl isomerase n=1 Tax=Mediterraneibacter gnavus TaxID=33038 RepID=UPI000C7DA546|nr:peptidylprolyl isomerase [Mediterraneibacter gnavus]PLT59799.1 peptidyl-prolyl cis-trans isomerase [Mediterraneibacter gnavus]